jgi:hypothetical protein
MLPLHANHEDVNVRRAPPASALGPRKTLLMLRHKLAALAIGNHHGVEDAPEKHLRVLRIPRPQRRFITLDLAAEERPSSPCWPARERLHG